MRLVGGTVGNSIYPPLAAQVIRAYMEAAQ